MRMKVKELILELQKYDGESYIVIKTYYNSLDIQPYDDFYIGISDIIQNNDWDVLFDMITF